MRYDPRTRLQQGPMGALVSQWGALSIGKGNPCVQTGTIELNGQSTLGATITAVNMSNALLFLAGNANASAGFQPNQLNIRMTLTNATTVTATRATSEAVSCLVRFFVLELAPGIIKQIQRFSGKDINGAASTTQALTQINLSKSFPIHLGTSYAAAGGNGASMYVAVALTTNVLATLTTGANPAAACLTSFDVVELF